MLMCIDYITYIMRNRKKYLKENMIDHDDEGTREKTQT